jgi:hypothetical protein
MSIGILPRQVIIQYFLSSYLLEFLSSYYVNDLQMLLPSLLNPGIQLGISFLGLPWVRPALAEHLFDLLDGFPAGLGVSNIN